MYGNITWYFVLTNSYGAPADNTQGSPYQPGAQACGRRLTRDLWRALGADSAGPYWKRRIGSRPRSFRAWTLRSGNILDHGVRNACRRRSYLFCDQADRPLRRDRSTKSARRRAQLLLPSFLLRRIGGDP